jgi:hypothetical protein
MSSCTRCDREEKRGGRSWADVFGLGFSGLCIAHCLALPVLVAGLPLWPALAAWHGGAHVLFLALIAPTTLLAMWVGFRRHGSFGPMSMLAGGLLIVITAQIVGHSVAGASSETALTVAGSSLLVAGHWRNWASSRKHARQCNKRG